MRSMSSVVIPGRSLSPTCRRVSAARRHTARISSISLGLLISTDTGFTPNSTRAASAHLLEQLRGGHRFLLLRGVGGEVKAQVPGLAGRRAGLGELAYEGDDLRADE